MIKRILAALAVVLSVGLATAPASATAPTASTAVAVVDLASLELGDDQGYNAVGPDRPWNLNSEWVDVHNTSDAAVKVKDLILEDAWRHGQPADYKGSCNRYVVATIPTASGPSEDLPGKHTLRIYMGQGESKVFGDGLFHAVYMNSPSNCGYYGHVWNNNPRKGDRFAAWDTAWIGGGSTWESKSYGFPYGFVAPTH